MGQDIHLNSLELLRQYQTHLRNFSNCVDVGVVRYLSELKKKKEELNQEKANFERKYQTNLEKIDYRIRQLDDLLRRFNFNSEDASLIKIEKNRFQTKRNSLEGKMGSIKEKYERQIGIIDDIINLTYSYGNRARLMADSANGSLAGVVTNIEKYMEK